MLNDNEQTEGNGFLGMKKSELFPLIIVQYC